MGELPAAERLFQGAGQRRGMARWHGVSAGCQQGRGSGGDGLGAARGAARGSWRAKQTGDEAKTPAAAAKTGARAAPLFRAEREAEEEEERWF